MSEPASPRSQLAAKEVHGEITLVAGPAPEEAADAGADALDVGLREALAGHSVKDAAALVAGALELAREG